MANRRVDFAVPHDARRSRCRYCLATVYWAIAIHRGPLHAATAIRNGAGETRMESHVAHCPQRSTALARAKSKPCPGGGCGERIEAGDCAPVVCPTCWTMLPDPIRAWVSREGRRKPRTEAFDEAVTNAVRLVGVRRKRQAGSQRTLFPASQYR